MDEHNPELRCFGSGCQERQLASESAAALHENTYHDGAQTVFLVVPNREGLGWAFVEGWQHA